MGINQDLFPLKKLDDLLKIFAIHSMDLVGNVYRASWRDIPERYGKWNTIYKCFAHWSNLGIFEKIFEKLSVESDFVELSIDSTM